MSRDENAAVERSTHVWACKVAKGRHYARRRHSKESPQSPTVRRGQKPMDVNCNGRDDVEKTRKHKQRTEIKNAAVCVGLTFFTKRNSVRDVYIQQPTSQIVFKGILASSRVDQRVWTVQQCLLWRLSVRQANFCGQEKRWCCFVCTAEEPRPLSTNNSHLSLVHAADSRPRAKKNESDALCMSL